MVVESLPFFALGIGMERVVGDGAGVDGVERKKEFIPLCVHISSLAFCLSRVSMFMDGATGVALFRSCLRQVMRPSACVLPAPSSLHATCHTTLSPTPLHDLLLTSLSISLPGCDTAGIGG